jgi:hypothetical protein
MRDTRAAMRFNILLADETGERLRQAAESRSALIRRAAGDRRRRHGTPQWPDALVTFQEIANQPRFGLVPPAVP